MKLKYILPFLAICIFNIKANSQTMSLPNIDFETGTFSGWDYFVGSCCPILTTTSTAATAYPTRFQITSGTGSDPYGFFPVVAPGGGSHSFKLGNTNTGSEAETIKYFVHVPTGSADYSILFRWAAVLEDPSHAAPAQPRFAISAYDSATGSAVSCAQFFFLSGPILYGFSHSIASSNVLFRGWTTGSANLSGLGGSTIVLEFSSGDCGYGGHFGYGYADVGYGLFAIANYSCDSFVTLNAPPGDSVYAWYDSATFSTYYGSATSVNVPVGSAPVTYALVMTHYAGFGCNDTLYTTVAPGSGSMHSHNRRIDTAVCFGAGTSLTLGTTDSSFSYSWSPSTGLSCDTCGTTVATPMVNTAYIVSATNGACSYTDTFNITGGHMVSTISGTNLSCYADSSGTVTATPVTGYAPYTYSWSTTPVQTTATATHLPAGTYTVLVTDSTGCIDSESVTITQPPAAGALTIGAFTDPTTCTGTDGTITVGGFTPSAAYTIRYWFGGSFHTLSATASGTGEIIIGSLAAGTYDSISVVTTGCPGNIVGPVTLTAPGGPAAPHAANSGPVCQDSVLSLFATCATSGVTFSWAGPGGFSSAVQNPSISGSVTAGIYTVTVTMGGCSATDTTSVTIKPNPVLYFTWNYPVCSGDTFQLYCYNYDSTAPYSYLWSGPGGFTSTLQNDFVYPASDSTSGIYVLTLGYDGCYASDSFYVYYDECEHFRLASGFTPNHDGHNDEFIPLYIDAMVNSYSFSIYNRWGNMVFSTTDKSQGWDGKFKGVDQPIEVYIYTVSGVLKNGKKVRQNGNITLIR